MKYIITDNNKMMVYTAAALSDLNVNGETYTYEDIRHSPALADNIKASFLKTRTEGGIAIVGKVPSISQFAVEDPERRLNIKFTEKYREYIEAFFEKNGIDEIIFALSHTHTNGLYTTLLQAAFSEKQYKLARTDVIDKEEIRKSINKPFPRAYFTAIKAKTDRKQFMQHLMKDFFNKNEIDLPPSPALFACLLLLKNRQDQIGPGERILAISTVENINLNLTSQNIMSRKRLKSLNNDKLSFLRQEFIPFPSRGFLYRLYNGTDKIDAEKTAMSLFIKGYITNPCTDAYFLPSDFSNSKIEKLTTILSEYTTTERKVLLRTIDESRTTLVNTQEPLPIIPVKPLDDSLSLEEQKLYKIITKSIVNSLTNSKSREYYFRAGMDIFKCSLDKKKPLIEADKNITYGAKFTSIEKKNGNLTGYTIGRFATDLSRMNVLGTMSLEGVLKILTEHELVRIEGSQISISQKGIALCKNLKTYKFENNFIKILDMVNGRYEKAYSFKKDLSGLRIKMGIPEEEHRDSSPVIGCPFCKSETLKKDKDKFVCKSCGKSIPIKLSVGEGILEVNGNDILDIVGSQRTRLKHIKVNGEIKYSGYLIIQDGKVSFTNKTTTKCPICNNYFSVYSWGYGCPKCNAAIPFELYEHKFDINEIEDIVSGDGTSPITFTVKGKIIKAKIYMDEKGKLRFRRT